MRVETLVEGDRTIHCSSRHATNQLGGAVDYASNVFDQTPSTFIRSVV